MLLTKKNILLISPEPWEHVFVSKHHYAINLATRGNFVYFLNPPTRKFCVEKTEIQNLYSLQYPGFLRGLRFLPSIIQRQQIKKTFSKLQALCSVKFHVIWSFDNSVFFDFSALPENVIRISHIVDLNQNFQLKDAASTADICFTVSNNILNMVKVHNPNSFFINHGFNHLQNINECKELPGCNFRKVVYSGNLSMLYIDWALLETAVRRNPKVDFIFIGPGMEDFNYRLRNMHKFKMECLNYKNVYKIGKVNSKELINWYRSADVLIVAYQEEYHKEQSNSHKMMEYLGSGKMIVATKTEEYKRLTEDQLFLMAEKNQNFPLILEQVLNNLSFWNSQDNEEKRIQFALSNTYEKQIDRIEKLLQNQVQKKVL